MEVRESLMEMDQARVEIRWGNCEKMAGVLTRVWSGLQELQATPRENVFCCFTYSEVTFLLGW